MAEALVSLTLSITILGMIGALMSRLSDSSRRAAQREAINQAAQAVLNRLVNDCRSAVRWTTPATTSNALASSLDLSLPDYSKPRFVVNSPDTFWKPFKPVNLVRIQYTLQADVLIRTLTPNGLSPEASAVSDSVTSFSAERNYQSVRLSLSLQDATIGTRTLSSEVVLPLQQCWGPP